MKGILKIIVILSAILVLVCLNALLIIYYYFQRDLPHIYNIKDYRPITTTDIFDREGRLLYRLYNEKRRSVDIKKIPKDVINAFLSAEDAEFFSHKGINFFTILRALLVNLISGEIRQGGSTITQQVVKTFFLTPERTISRKIKEAILSFRLERYLTKEEILGLYLNQIYFGAGNYGIYEASRYFFSKAPEDLTIPEAAFLAALVKAPEPFASLKNPERVRDRHVHIIRQMERHKFISADEARRYIDEGLHLRLNENKQENSYAISYAITHLTNKIPLSKLYNGGYTIRLTIDKEINETVERLLMDYLDEKNAENAQPLLTLPENEYPQIEADMRDKVQNIRDRSYKISKTFKSPDESKDERLGIQLLEPFRGDIPFKEYLNKYAKVAPLLSGNLYIGIIAEGNNSELDIFTGESVVTISNQSKPKRGDLKKGDVVLYRVGANNEIRLSNQPLIQGAVIILDNKDGGILAMSGGYSYALSKFNRATQARRQPGSSFKPVIYSYAIETGKYNITSVENDTPVQYIDPQTGSIYRPSNYDKDEYKGEMTLIDAIAESKNTISVKILLSLGLNEVAEFVNGLGLGVEVKPYPSVALGSFEISLLSLCRFYSALARGGSLSEDNIILSVKDESGEEIFDLQRRHRQILLPETAFIITRMLGEVVKSGTGTTAYVDGYNLVGKTGTTDNYTNAWFIGYTPDITIGVMIGRDDNKSMGEKATGGGFAAPLVRRILSSASMRERASSENLPVPKNIKFINVDIHSGKRCLDYEKGDCEFLPYIEGFEPPEEGRDNKDLDIMRIDQ